MKRLLALFTIVSFLAVAPCGFAAPNPTTGGDKPEANNDAEARALRTAELKLAELAKEAKQADAGGTNWESASAPAPAAKKKKGHAAGHKKTAKTHLAGTTKGGAAGMTKVLNRRLTDSEVKGILATTRDFSGTDLSGLNLVGQNLSGAKFNRANLHLANLERADLTESDLELADLTGANLRGASLNQARLRGTRLEGSRMEGALWIDKTVCRSGSVGNCLE